MFEQTEQQVRPSVEWLRLSVEALGALVIAIGIVVVAVGLIRHALRQRGTGFANWLPLPSSGLNYFLSKELKEARAGETGVMNVSAPGLQRILGFEYLVVHIPN